MSFRRHKDCIDSGVAWLGDVPSHWDVVRLRRLVEIKKDIAGELGYDVFSVTQNGFRIKDTESGEGQQSLDYSKYQFVKVGQFGMNPMDLLTGGADIATTVGVTSPDYRVFEIRNAEVVHDRYMLYMLQMLYRNHIFYAFGQGSSQLGRWRLPRQQFNDFQFPVPPPDEQKAISSFLDVETSKIDGLVSEQRRLIELLKEKRQSVISHAVTKGLNPNAPMKPSGVQWLGDVPQHWSVQRVKTVSSFVTSGPRGWSDRIADDGSLFIQSGDLNDDLGIEFYRSKRVQVDDDAETTRTQLFDGDVVVCVTGAKTGKVAVCTNVPEIAYVNQHLCLVRPNDNVLPRFLGILLKSEIGLTYFDFSQYGLKQGLSLEDVKNAPVFIPPREEQLEIVEYVDQQADTFHTLQAEAERAIELLQERRTALISAAVTGKIDVRGYSPKKNVATSSNSERRAADERHQAIPHAG